MTEDHDAPLGISLPTWQFLRLMEFVASLPLARLSQGMLHWRNRWDDRWVQLDAQLIDLSLRDENAFIRQYFDRLVYLSPLTLPEWDHAVDVIDLLLDHYRQLLANSEIIELVEEWSFERDEFARLRASWLTQRAQHAR